MRAAAPCATSSASAPAKSDDWYRGGTRTVGVREARGSWSRIVERARSWMRGQVNRKKVEEDPRVPPRNIYIPSRVWWCRVSVCRCVTGLFTERFFVAACSALFAMCMSLPPSRFALRSERPVRTGVRSCTERRGWVAELACSESPFGVRSLAPHILVRFTRTHCRLTIPEHEAHLDTL